MATNRTVIIPEKIGDIERRTFRLLADLPKGRDATINFVRQTYAPQVPEALIQQPDRDHSRMLSVVQAQAIEIVDTDGIARMVTVGSFFETAADLCDRWAIQDGEVAPDGN